MDVLRLIGMGTVCRVDRGIIRRIGCVWRVRLVVGRARGWIIVLLVLMGIIGRWRIMGCVRRVRLAVLPV